MAASVHTNSQVLDFTKDKKIFTLAYFLLISEPNRSGSRYNLEPGKTRTKR